MYTYIYICIYVYLYMLHAAHDVAKCGVAPSQPFVFELVQDMGMEAALALMPPDPIHAMLAALNNNINDLVSEFQQYQDATAKLDSTLDKLGSRCSSFESTAEDT